MKKLYWLLILIACHINLYAESVEEGEAKIIALNWINSLGGDYYQTGNIQKVYSRVENDVPIFYLITFSPSGWVIVSGTDIAEPVLGYSLNSQFDIKQMPPQVEGWMGGITSEIKSAIDTKLTPSSEVRQKWLVYGGKLVKKPDLKSVQSPMAGPLLSSTWNQGRFYNEMAPADLSSGTGNGHVWLGCVATAMAQVMKYWEYPTSGMGSHSYFQAKYGTQSAEFGTTTYNWSAMPNNVTSLNTEVQKIGYHCAVSVDMAFGPGSSGAFLSGEAFINYFKYNSTIFESDKDRWDDLEWKAQLKREIDAGRPVIYSGYNATYTSGHAWVCDGYSGEYFHFNWGWSGAYNGDFLLSFLNPGGTNYSTDQVALFGIEPITTASIPIPYGEGFESAEPVGISLTGVSGISTFLSHTGMKSLKLGKESIVSFSTNAASLCFIVPPDAELNFWVKRFTPNSSAFNQQKAMILPQYGMIPLVEIFNGDYNDPDWVNYNVNLSAYSGQVVRLQFLQDVTDISKQQWMYIDDISITGINNNIAPFIPSNPLPADRADLVTLNPTLHWSGGDPNGDDLIYKIHLGTSNPPPLIGSAFDNNYTASELNHSTTYFWKIIADDGSLVTEGPTWSFTTKGIPPTLGNCGISNFTSKSMTVCGEILNYNNTTVSSRGICWSLTPNPSLSTNFQEAHEPSTVFLCDITGLLPYTKYYYCAYSISSQGNAYSDLLNLTTRPDLPVVTIEKIENVLRSSAMVKGKVISVNDSAIIQRGVVWSTESGFNPLLGHQISENGNWKASESFTVKLKNLPGPGNFFFRVFAVNSVGISYSDETMISTLNQAPIIDLDVNNSKGAGGNNFFGSVLEQLAGGKISDTDVEISDLDGDTIRQVDIHLLNPFNSDLEFLAVFSNNENLIVEGDLTGHIIITSRKNLTYDEWKSVLKSIEYRNYLDSPHPETIRQIQVQLSDGFDLSKVATAYLTVIPVNDPPLNQTIPSLNAPVVLGSRVLVEPGTWGDILDECEGTFLYSYTWQMKNDIGEITDLGYVGPEILSIGENLCGNSIRVIEKATDANCGGSNIVSTNAASEWILVGRVSQTITIDQVPVHNYHEEFFTLKGKATSELPIYFSVPENNYISISNDTVYIKNAGALVFSGIQPGNECYLPSQLLYRSVFIEKSEQNINCEKTFEVKFNMNRMKIPATSTSGLGLSVVSSDSSVAFVENDTIIFTRTGKTILSISQTGNQNYFPSDTVEMSLTVLKGDQSITTQHPNDLIFGKGSFPFIAVSSSQLDVKLSSSDPSVLEIAGDSLIVKGVGEVLVVAKQPGDDLWNAAQDVVVPFFVKKGIQKIDVETISDKVIFDAPFNPVCYSSSGLDVSFSVRDTSIAMVTNGKITLKKVGETVIDFIQNGNQFWESASNETPLLVFKANQIITFDVSKELIFGDEPIPLSAQSSSGLGVVFDISDKKIGAISGDTLYIYNAGTAIITASQTGNEKFNQAVPVSINISIKKASQSIISNLPDSLVFEHQIIFADVRSTSGLMVDIVSSDDGIVKVVSDSLEISGTGKVTLTLSQHGNENFLPVESIVNVVVNKRVNIPDLESADFILFPNPTKGKAFLISSGELTYPLEINIVNATGKTIKTFDAEKPGNQIDLSDQPQGLYIVVLRSANINVALKLLINR